MPPPLLCGPLLENSVPQIFKTLIPRLQSWRLMHFFGAPGVWSTYLEVNAGGGGRRARVRRLLVGAASAPCVGENLFLQELWQRWLLADRSDPRCDLANILGAWNRPRQRFVLDAEHVGDAGPVKQLPRQAQCLCLGPRLDVHYLKAVRRHEIKDFEQVGNHSDNKACGRAIGNDNMGVLELMAVAPEWPKIRLSCECIDSVGCADEAGEGRRPERLVNGTGSLDEKDITGTCSLIGICVTNTGLQVGDHVLGALVARGNNVSAMLILLPPELLLDGFDHFC
jgi:hypothetical protein